MGSDINKKTPYPVMLSSTYKELAEHREAVRKAMLGQRLLPVAMEDDSALPDQDLIDASLAKVEESDAYVGLISYRYGQVTIDPIRNPEQLSLTELEFRRAVARKIPICMFIMHEDHPIPRRAVGAERGVEQKFEAFVQLAKKDRIYAEFKSLDDLKVKTVQSLVKLREILERSSAPVVFPSASRADRASRAASGDASTASNDLVRPAEGGVTENETTRRPDVAAPAPNAQAEPVVSGQTTRKHTTAPFYSDHAARRDLLNRKAVAETIATMIESVWKDDGNEENVDRTFMVHLHGRWGSGKTSILNFLKDALLLQATNASSNVGGLPNKTANPSWIVVDYNAWRNQSLGPAWWTLLETVHRQARDQLRGWLAVDGISLILRDRWWRVRSSYAPYALAAVLAVAFGLLLIWIWQTQLFGAGKPWFIDGLKIIASIVGLIVAIFAFGHSYPIGSARTAKSYLELSRDPLGPLIKRYGDLVSDIGKPVAVFIDDLDRCNAEFVVELLQTIQTLFRHAKVLYVVAADRDWVCASYQQQYKTFNETIGEPGKSLGHLFVEKVFQLSVEVPHLSEGERNQYWDELINSRLSPKNEVSKEIIDEVTNAIERAQTESEVVEVIERYREDPERADIAAAKGFQRMQAAPLREEREHFLSEYAKLIEPNPRAMKRLLNAYGFRRGFDIQSRRRSDPDALVRWTILENRWPILADYLEGRSRGTEIIEALMKDEAVLEVSKGLTWEKLRPVASAPDQPPTPEITPGAAAKAYNFLTAACHTPRRSHSDSAETRSPLPGSRK